jgi:hypothetical protein
MTEDTFIIYKANDVKHTRYIAFTSTPGCDDMVFEGCTVDGVRKRPLEEAKLYAKKHGYKFLAVDSMSTKRLGKTYDLTTKNHSS